VEPKKPTETKKPTKPIESKPAKPDPEADASRKLKLAKGFLPDDKDTARRRLKELIEQYPGTKVAEEAKKILEKLLE
jgi:hypothetical protein